MNTNSKPSLRAVERAEARAKLAEMRTEQAKSRVEAAETRTEQAETRTEAAKTRTEHAEMRTEQAETRAEQAEAIVERLVPRKALRPSANAAPDERAAGQRALDQLPTRQREILHLLAAGQTTKQMAAHLHISPKTVEYHRLKLMRALNVHSIPGLVRVALRSEVDPPEG